MWEKEKNAGNKHFSPFPTMFSTDVSHLLRFILVISRLHRFLFFESRPESKFINIIATGDSCESVKLRSAHREAKFGKQITFFSSFILISWNKICASHFKYLTLYQNTKISDSSILKKHVQRTDKISVQMSKKKNGIFHYGREKFIHPRLSAFLD